MIMDAVAEAKERGRKRALAKANEQSEITRLMAEHSEVGAGAKGHPAEALDLESDDPIKAAAARLSLKVLSSTQKDEAARLIAEYGPRKLSDE